jgi:hypothetical protein
MNQLKLETLLEDSVTYLGTNHRTVNYISIGCAANMTEKKIKKLCVSEYHQFPLFLMELLNQHPDIHINLILIDPFIEEPPYITTTNIYDLELEWENHDGSNVYECDNITVFSFKNSFQYDDNYDNLRTINNYCIDNNQLLFVNDFTGRDLSLIANYFDKELGDNLDKIMYDITIRNNIGCFTDLTDVNNMPIIYLDNDLLKIKNPFIIKTLEDSNLFMTDHVSKSHYIQFLKYKLNMYKDVYGIFRRFYVFKSSNNDWNSLTKYMRQ